MLEFPARQKPAEKKSSRRKTKMEGSLAAFLEERGLLENIGQVIIPAWCGTFKSSGKTHDAHGLMRRHTGSSAHIAEHKHHHL